VYGITNWNTWLLFGGIAVVGRMREMEKKVITPTMKHGLKNFIDK
jgi:hypothetical protein